MIESLAVVYVVGAIGTGVVVFWFDGGHDYRRKVSRYGPYTSEVHSVRRNGETGLHALGRILLKTAVWPVLVCSYVLRPLLEWLYSWLTEEHEPERPE